MSWKDATVKIVFSLFPLSFALPLPLFPKSLFLGMFLVASILIYGDLRAPIKQRAEITMAIAFFSFFVIEAIIAFIREGRVYIHTVRLSFIILPIIFWFAGRAFTIHRKLIYNAFLIGVYGYIAYALSYVIYFYGFHSESSVFGLDYYLKYVLYHFMPGAIHHTYIGMFMCFAMLLLFFESGLKPGIKLGLATPILLFIPFLGSKLSLAVAFLILLYWLIQQENFKKWRWFIVFAVAMVNTGLFLFTDLFRTLSISLGNRISYYECVVLHAKNNLLSGVGYTNIKEFMDNCPFMGEKMDTHNIVFQELLASGIFGMASLVTLFIVLYKNAKKNPLFKLFLTVFLVFGTVEHLFNIQLGVTFFVFFCYVMFDSDPSVITKSVEREI